MLSVEGQRSRPSLLTRLERLKAVASSPATRASPEAVKPCRAASASMASQIALCEQHASGPDQKESCLLRKQVLCIVPRCTRL